MCGSMVDIQSATAEIRRGKKKEEEETTGQNIMSASAIRGAACVCVCVCVCVFLSSLLLFYGLLSEINFMMMMMMMIDDRRVFLHFTMG